MNNYTILILAISLGTITLDLNAQSCLPASSTTTMDVNNVDALFNNGGDMWWDFSTARYEVPKGSGKKPFFMNSLWLTAIDENDDLKCAAVRYRSTGNDYWPGPIFTDSNGNNYTDCSPFDRHWSVKKIEIDAFISGSSTVADGITNWPAIGNPNLSVSLEDGLAPFVDVNGDGLYIPDSGDYPDIKGDQAVFWVINDIGNLHTESGGAMLGVEIHVMAYAYQSSNVVNNTTFYDYSIINKSEEDYHDFGLGFFTDGGLGNYYDDYVGCDSNRSLGYFFNADSLDEDFGGLLGYGLDLPVAGIRMVKLPKNSNGLEVPMTHFGYFNNANGPTGDPSIAQDYFNYMNGKWRDGTPWTIGANGYNPGDSAAIKTNFMFSGNPTDTNGWSECTNGNVPGDRRMVQSHSGINLDAGQKVTFTMAAIFSQEEAYKGSCVDMTPFFEQTDTVKKWSDDRLCENFSLTLDANITNTNGQDGAIELIAVGTASNLNYAWSNGESSKDLDQIGQGVYSITATNDNGCTESAQFEVEPVGIDDLNMLTSLKLYPNPSKTGRFMITTSADAPILVEVFNLLGHKMLEQPISNSELDLSSLNNGVYLVESSIGNSSAINKVIISR